MLPEVNALRAPLLELGVSHGRPPALSGDPPPLVGVALWAPSGLMPFGHPLVY